MRNGSVESCPLWLYREGRVLRTKPERERTGDGEVELSRKRVICCERISSNISGSKK